jgi:hypothetical protein
MDCRATIPGGTLSLLGYQDGALSLGLGLGGGSSAFLGKPGSTFEPLGGVAGMR